MNSQENKPSLVTAFKTPTAFSDSLEGALEDLNLKGITDAELLDVFPGRTLDVGSGLEGFACGLYEKAARAGRAITVVSLNPQFADWSRGAADEIVYKQVPIAREIGYQPFGETYLARHRIALAGLVQQLPFRSGTFDTVVSTWAFPTVFQERGLSDDQFRMGFEEIFRVLKPEGKVLLGPIVEYKEGPPYIDRILATIPESKHYDKVWGAAGPFFPNHFSLKLYKK